MKQHLLAATLFITASATHAKVRFSAGPQVGYTLATADYKDSNVTFDNRYRSGLSGGLTVEVGVGHLLIRPAMLYAQKGCNQEYTADPSLGYTGHSSTRTRVDYLTVPLAIGYAQHSDGQGFQVFAGFVLGGHYNSEQEYTRPYSSSVQHETYTGHIVTNNNASKGTDLPVRSPDFSVQGGVGYRYQLLLAQLEYSLVL